MFQKFIEGRIPAGLRLPEVARREPLAPAGVVAREVVEAHDAPSGLPLGPVGDPVEEQQVLEVAHGLVQPRLAVPVLHFHVVRVGLVQSRLAVGEAQSGKLARPEASKVQGPGRVPQDLGEMGLHLPPPRAGLRAVPARVWRAARLTHL